MLELIIALLPLDVPPPSPITSPGPGVYPVRSNGFAAYILGGFFGLGLIILATVLISMKPKRVDPPPTLND